MKDMKCLTISDIHLGHTRNTTPEIIRNLDTFFSHYTSDSQFTDYDIIFLAGDIFDTLLDSSSPDVQLIKLWFGRLMIFCYAHGIKLRVLEGTPSHDWRQSRNAQTVFQLIDKPVDFRYIDTLYIEHFKDFDAYVLYVPDEWTASTALTLSQVKELLKEKGLSQVDMAVMHGAFDHQLPPAAKKSPVHDASEYLSLVKHYITIGHIHIHSVFDRILAQGSFDRLSHNEESAKGAIATFISETKGNSFYFIENKNAKIFKTIVLKHLDLDRSMLQVDKVVKNLPDNSYVRIKATKSHPLYVAFDDLKVLYPMLFFTKTSIEDEDVNLSLPSPQVTLNDSYDAVTITRENVVSLIMQEVRDADLLEGQDLTLLQTLLEANHV